MSLRCGQRLLIGVPEVVFGDETVKVHIYVYGVSGRSYVTGLWRARELSVTVLNDALLLSRALDV